VSIQDKHHSRGLLVKVNKPNRYFAQSVDKHHIDSRTSLTTISFTSPPAYPHPENTQETITKSQPKQLVIMVI
jgi:hypothetical protein